MVIFNSRSCSFPAPKRRVDRARTKAAMTTKNKTARTTYPIPVASPMAMARKIIPISRALPGAERKRTRLNAPATATPAPIFPLTSIMTIWTTAGIIANVTTKLWV